MSKTLLLLGIWVLLLLSSARLEAQGQGLVVEDTKGLVAALRRPEITTIELGSDITLNETEWPQSLTVTIQRGRNVTITGEAMGQDRWPLVDFVGYFNMRIVLEPTSSLTWTRLWMIRMRMSAVLLSSPGWWSLHASLPTDMGLILWKPVNLWKLAVHWQCDREPPQFILLRPASFRFLAMVDMSLRVSE